MGFFNNLKVKKVISNSINKTESMTELIDALNYGGPDKEIRITKAKESFYRVISSYPGLNEIIKQGLFDFNEFNLVFERYIEFGYNRWIQSDYVPVSLFSFQKPLRYIVENKEIFLKSKDSDLIIETCDNSISELNDY